MGVPLLLDEQVPYALVGALRQLGIDVLHIIDTSLRGAADEEVLAAAVRMGRVLVTLNVADFSRLAISWAEMGRQHAGILLVPGQPTVSDLVHRIRQTLHARSAEEFRNTVLFLGSGGQS